MHRDPRSWKVRTRLDEKTVGEVEGVLLDENGAPRYLEVELDDDDRHVLLPIGHASPDPTDEVVWVNGMDRNAFRDIPPYEGEPTTVDADYEHRLGTAYEGAYGREGFYESPHYTAGWERHRDDDVERSATPARVDTMDDIDVADHDHDPRGWDVVGRDGERLGTVDHLMGDNASMKVRYLIVEPDSELTDDGRHVLVPIGHVALDPDHEQVRIDALDRTRIGGVPTWGGDRVERDHERALTAYLSDGYRGEHRYRHPRYRADRFSEPTHASV